jgi:hypothetical protein
VTEIPPSPTLVDAVNELTTAKAKRIEKHLFMLAKYSGLHPAGLVNRSNRLRNKHDLRGVAHA